MLPRTVNDDRGDDAERSPVGPQRIERQHETADHGMAVMKRLRVGVSI